MVSVYYCVYKSIKMKFVIFFVFACVAATLAAPEAPRPFIPVLERTEKHDEVGQFALRYITADGITVEESGALRPTADGKDFVLDKLGSYTYTAPNGQVIRTSYVADANGFRAEGDHLPKAPIA